MTERPILFSAPMVRAIRDDSKTQTRRIVKPQPGADIVDIEYEPEADLWLGNTQEDNDLGFSSSWSARCPYGQPGDRLWVRETWCPACPESQCPNDGRPQKSAGELHCFAYYRATDKGIVARDDDGMTRYERSPWKPSIHMPRWASRITLEVTGVRVERLQDISEKDAWAEGVLACDGLIDETDIVRAAKLCGVAIDDARATFFALFANIYGWELLSLNPWVWVVEFRRLP